MSEKDVPAKKIVFARMLDLNNGQNCDPSINAEKLTLDNVAAYDADIDIGDASSSSIITLHKVPKFLIEAFARFGELEGCKVEGIFRKEGNAARMKGSLPIFFGCDKIPPTLQVHDICSWIKKFFRDLKTPVFREHEEKMTKLVTASRDSSSLLTSLISVIHELPQNHIGTLGYLMRCLREVTEHSDEHQMTSENLATVFAPALFTGTLDAESMKLTKKKLGSQEDLLENMKKTTTLQAQVVKLLIENAEMIGIQNRIYITTRHPSDVFRTNKDLITSSMQLRVKMKSCSNGSKVSRSASVTSKQNSEPPPDAQRKRSLSVVRAFGALKSTFRKSWTDLAPSPFQPKTTAKYNVTPLVTSVSSESTSTSSTSTPYQQRKGKDIFNIVTKGFVSPKDPKKRPEPLNLDSASTTPTSIKSIPSPKPRKAPIVRKRSSTTSAKKQNGPKSGTSSKICRAATQMVKRLEPRPINRERRHTAPVTSSIKRMRPNSRSSGLTPRVRKFSNPKLSPSIESSSRPHGLVTERVKQFSGHY